MQFEYTAKDITFSHIGKKMQPSLSTGDVLLAIYEPNQTETSKITEKGEGHKTLLASPTLRGVIQKPKNSVDLLSSSQNKLSKSPDILQEGNL